MKITPGKVLGAAGAVNLQVQPYRLPGQYAGRESAAVRKGKKQTRSVVEEGFAFFIPAYRKARSIRWARQAYPLLPGIDEGAGNKPSFVVLPLVGSGLAAQRPDVDSD
jgi:hypothetical protein